MSLSNHCCVIEASLTVFSVYFVKCLPQNVLICSEYRLLSLPHLILNLAKLVLPLSFPCGSAVSWKLRLSATSDRNMFWLPIVIYLKVHYCIYSGGTSLSGWKARLLNIALLLKDDLFLLPLPVLWLKSRTRSLLAVWTPDLILIKNEHSQVLYEGAKTFLHHVSQKSKILCPSGGMLLGTFSQASKLTFNILNLWKDPKASLSSVAGDEGNLCPRSLCSTT